MIETATQHVVDQGILGVLLVLACAAVVTLYLRDEKKIESLRTQKDAEIKQLYAEKEAILKETLQRDNDHFTTVQRVLEVVRPGA